MPSAPSWTSPAVSACGVVLSACSGVSFSRVPYAHHNVLGTDLKNNERSRLQFFVRRVRHRDLGISLSLYVNNARLVAQVELNRHQRTCDKPT